MLRYRCLVLDHDDTTVDSTRSVNYPQFKEALAHFRPGMTMSAEEYMLYCYEPGFYEMCEQVLHYTSEEMDAHIDMWKTYHKTHTPEFFPGISELIKEQHKRGGYVCVVSHSSKDVIENAYRLHNVELPDLIYGAEQPPDRRKPAPWPLIEIMQHLKLSAKDLLMIDDMPFGATMARAVGVDFVGVGWCDPLPQIKQNMIKLSDHYFSAVQQLYQFLYD